MKERIRLLKRLLLVSAFAAGINSACDLGLYNANPSYLFSKRKLNQSTFLAKNGPLELYGYCGPEIPGVYPRVEPLKGEPNVATSLEGSAGSVQVIQRMPSREGSLGIGTGQLGPNTHYVTADLLSVDQERRVLARVEAVFHC